MASEKQYFVYILSNWDNGAVSVERVNALRTAANSRERTGAVTRGSPGAATPTAERTVTHNNCRTINNRN
jgi:hypothetical protein